MPALAPSAVVPAAADLLHGAQARFRALDGYRVTLRSLSADGLRQVISYAYRKPGWIRLDFAEPHRGAILIYDPATRRVHLRPFGKGRFPTLDLAPDNPLIRSPAGHRVDRSDVGTLIAKLVELRAQGTMTDPVDATISERTARYVEITTAAADADGVRRYRVWFERGTLFPLKVQSFDATLKLIETVDMSDAELDPVFPERFFTL
ncbi:hypothetical protein GPA22_21100 [Aromatoleum toluvorans]|uniref:Outer membrane lipoprotein-sorting protein n=1 Tax=Aromatoleum toluvorans TaxID=92002 RepID=A0ABX1Q5P9_9RHOO|nr:hypothetical protein [Aromatoleum toluvorans]NMG46222.1 hypothetical protein [Aromatoleum toluvorans]